MGRQLVSLGDRVVYEHTAQAELIVITPRLAQVCAPISGMTLFDGTCFEDSNLYEILLPNSYALA